MKRYIILILTAFALFSVSCQRELEEGYGYINFTVGNDVSEELLVKSETVPAAEGYIVDIYDSAGNLVISIPDHRTVTSDNPVELMMGKYKVAARNADVPDGAFNTDFYGVEKEVTVRADETLSVDLTCVRTDCKLSVDFPDEFSDHFSVYKVAVTNGADGVLPLVLSNDPDPSDSRQSGLASKASFRVTGNLRWNLYMKNKDSQGENGGVYTLTKTYNNVQPGQRYHLVFNLKDAEDIEGGLALRVSVNGETIEEDHDIILDFDKKDMPSYTTTPDFTVAKDEEGNPVRMLIIFEDASAKRINVNAPAGLKSLVVSHYDDDLLAAGLPKMTELVGDDHRLKNIGITAGVGSKEAVIDFTSFIGDLPEGSYDLSVTAVDVKGRYIRYDFPFEIMLDVDAEILSASAWAKFADLEARYFSDSPRPEGLTFQYRPVSSTAWTTVDASAVKYSQDALRYSVRIDGLVPSTQYAVRAMSASDIEENKDSKEITFTTEAAPVILNMGFDYWYKDGSVWYPNVNINGSNYVWDTANGGTSTVSIYPTNPEEQHLAVSGVADDGTTAKKAAKLTSLEAPLVGIAAGNIYTGDFVTAEMSLTNPGAQLDWGAEFSGRPLALRGYVDYRPGEVNVNKKILPAGANVTVGGPDVGQIQILLTDWSNQFRINTQTSTFVQFDTDEAIIAYSSLDVNDTGEEYVRFTLPIRYRTLDRIPKYVVIVGSASKYGDYFTGSTSSVMYLDEFEFIYDPADLTEEEYNAVFSNTGR